MKEDNIDTNWDLIVIGGGITGAGIFREAQKNGIKTLLLEMNDFAWGTSSRSSKLVHGGLRYLKEKQFKLTYESVKEREKLMKELPSLVKPLGFMMPIYDRIKPSKLSVKLGLTIYDLMALKWQHRFFPVEEVKDMAGNLIKKDLKGIFRFEDAVTDDARLVLRLLFEDNDTDSKVLNYHMVESVVPGKKGFEVSVLDKESSKEKVFFSKKVINATGVWSDKISKIPGSSKFLRPLRGSHIIVSRDLIPVDEAIGFSHPDDGRMLFIVPWQGVVLCGTTDVDHSENMSREPNITFEEYQYIIRGLEKYFPVEIKNEDVISTFAGIRPVISSGGLKPSQESREYMLWKDNGIVSVTGGKLTTFRKIAADTLKEAGFKIKTVNKPLFSEKIPEVKDTGIDSETLNSLYGRYGEKVHNIISCKDKKLLSKIPSTEYLWAELIFSAENEKVKRLSDLLLRRVRIGNILKEGGTEHLDYIEEILEKSLNWDKERWKKEKEEYKDLIREDYGVPSS